MATTQVDKLSAMVDNFLKIQEETKPQQTQLTITDNHEVQNEVGLNNNLWIQIPDEEYAVTTSTDTLIMDCLTTPGFKGAVEKYQQDPIVSFPEENFPFEVQVAIANAIAEGRVEEAIRKLNRFFPYVLDNEPYLYFHLQQLRLIELVRAGRIEEALIFAKLHLNREHEENPLVLYETERTMALFAFQDPINSPFGDLLQPQYRLNVANEVNTAISKRLV